MRALTSGHTRSCQVRLRYSPLARRILHAAWRGMQQKHFFVLVCLKAFQHGLIGKGLIQIDAKTVCIA